MTCNTTGCTLAAYARVPRKCSSALGWPGNVALRSSRWYSRFDLLLYTSSEWEFSEYRIAKELDRRCPPPPLQITTLPPATSKQRCHAKCVALAYGPGPISIGVLSVCCPSP